MLSPDLAPQVLKESNRVLEVGAITEVRHFHVTSYPSEMLESTCLTFMHESHTSTEQQTGKFASDVTDVARLVFFDSTR